MRGGGRTNVCGKQTRRLPLAGSVTGNLFNTFKETVTSRRLSSSHARNWSDENLDPQRFEQLEVAAHEQIGTSTSRGGRNRKIGPLGWFGRTLAFLGWCHDALGSDHYRMGCPRQRYGPPKGKSDLLVFAACGLGVSVGNRLRGCRPCALAWQNSRAPCDQTMTSPDFTGFYKVAETADGITPRCNGPAGRNGPCDSNAARRPGRPVNADPLSRFRKTSCDPLCYFHQTSRWTAASIIVQVPRTKNCNRFLGRETQPGRCPALWPGHLRNDAGRVAVARQMGLRPEWMAEWMEPFARTIDAAKKYVVSSTLERVDWNAELVARRSSQGRRTA